MRIAFPEETKSRRVSEGKTLLYPLLEEGGVPSGPVKNPPNSDRATPEAIEDQEVVNNQDSITLGLEPGGLWNQA
jgi:hypothetical protein